MSQIGVNIKKLRKVKGLSQQAFADLFNLTRGNISSYEELRAEPKIEVVLHIAKYFCIPVSELLEKQLTVNEILNFGDHFEDSIKVDQNSGLNAIPFIGREYFQQPKTTDDWSILPKIIFPVYHKQQLLAVENSSLIPNPSNFPFEEHAILFFESVEIEILHTLDQSYGFYCKGEDLFFGEYVVNGTQIDLVLNAWRKIAFKPEHKAGFWKLFAKFERVI
ncbi:helix-turn-helix domain-containing protein [Sphingobacterium faecale]|uniref:Helix-turn-helix transcriptional regulator n=1 Tax=Sphingobacterium faecale TaxID=2803775 RepID=A0ABS1R7V4_9SPHI|nr:helix-turn-helix transcriptional regulator [Sphingobacterium faecale]MBL1410595.1 helix-turn-helix transcriptional regulator [Sphingobacterium faecale]